MSEGPQRDLKDHDLLIRLNTKMEGLEQTMKDNAQLHASALKELREGLIARVGELEKRANDNDNFHTEIKTTLRVWAVVLGFIGTFISIIVQYIFKRFFNT